MANKKPRKRVPKDKISRQEETFCQTYANNGGKGAEAVLAAWPHTAKWSNQNRAVKASKLLAKGKIRERLENLAAIVREKANSEFSITAEEILYRLALLGRASLKDYVTLDAAGQPTVAFKGTTDEQWYALNEVVVEDIEQGPRKGKRTKIKMADRIAALTKIGQNMGMFKVDLTLSGKGGGPVQVIMSSAEAAV